MTIVKMLPYIFVMALITYLIRATPILLIKKKITNRFLLSFLYYIPFAVLSAMTFPAIFSATGHLSSSLVGLLIAVLIAWRRPNLILVSLSACAGALVTEWILLLF